MRVESVERNYAPDAQRFKIEEEAEGVVNGLVL